mgnify:CR=1 FL=1
MAADTLGVHPKQSRPHGAREDTRKQEPHDTPAQGLAVAPPVSRHIVPAPCDVVPRGNATATARLSPPTWRHRGHATTNATSPPRREGTRRHRQARGPAPVHRGCAARPHRTPRPNAWCPRRGTPAPRHTPHQCGVRAYGGHRTPCRLTTCPAPMHRMGVRAYGRRMEAVAELAAGTGG